MTTGRVWLLSLVGGVVLSAGQVLGGEYLDSPMYKDPQLPVRDILHVFPERTTTLWLKALEQPEAELRCKAASAIARAHVRKVKGLERTIEPLLAQLDREEQHPTVRLAVAHALVTMDVRQAAPSLFRHARSGNSQFRNLVEPALARWHYQPAGPVWLERIQGSDVPARSLILAIRGLVALQETRACARLRELLFAAAESAPIRLEAARALGSLQKTGLEKDAELLARDPAGWGIVARLAAASLLREHDSQEARAILERLVQDPSPAVVARAAGRLLDIDAEALGQQADRLLSSPAAQVRSLGVDVLFQLANEERIGLLGDRLDDVHPAVREKARKHLQELGKKKEWQALVIAQGMRLLEGENWRGQEQAAVLLVRFDHKQAATRLVELLRSQRAEVAVVSGWGLRKLAVPDTRGPVLEHVRGKLNWLLQDAPGGMFSWLSEPYLHLDYQLSQLNQFLGQEKYLPAGPVLVRFIQRRESRPIGPESRAAAIWALGLIHEGKRQERIVDQLEARVNDVGNGGMLPPEDIRVRGLSAISIGRLKGKKALPSLDIQAQNEDPAQDFLTFGSAWAIQQLTGKPMSTPRPVRRYQRDWFLVPNR
jgi:HEAT repeat protein